MAGGHLAKHLTAPSNTLESLISKAKLSWLNQRVSSFVFGRESLVRSIHFSLFWRLSIAGLVISTALSLLVYFSERENVTRLLSQQAREVTYRFNQQIKKLFDDGQIPERQAIAQSLQILMVASNIRNVQGQLVYVAVYDEAGLELATVVDEDHKNIQAVQSSIGSARLQNPTGRREIVDSRQIAGNPYVFLSSPILNSEGEAAGYIQEMIAVSSRVLDNIEDRSYRMMLAVFAIVLTTTLAVYPIIRPLMNQLLRLTRNLLVSNLEILQVLGSAVAKRDSDTDRHNFRVTIYAVRLAEAVHLCQDKICSLIKGAFLHDVGKIGISDQILLKPGALTPDEIEEMKNHVQYGIDIIRRSEWLREAEDVVVHHHEQYGGNGYPQGIKGRSIPITARIFSIVDVFDALTSKRPYKESMSCQEAIHWIKQKSAVYFDPALVAAFVPIAESMFAEIHGEDAANLHLRMESILQKYFILAVR